MALSNLLKKGTLPPWDCMSLPGVRPRLTRWYNNHDNGTFGWADATGNKEAGFAINSQKMRVQFQLFHCSLSSILLRALIRLSWPLISVKMNRHSFQSKSMLKQLWKKRILKMQLRRFHHVKSIQLWTMFCLKKQNFPRSQMPPEFLPSGLLSLCAFLSRGFDSFIVVFEWNFIRFFYSVYIFLYWTCKMQTIRFKKKSDFNRPPNLEMSLWFISAARFMKTVACLCLSAWNASSSVFSRFSLSKRLHYSIREILCNVSCLAS